jgi:hypothetical protein
VSTQSKQAGPSTSAPGTAHMLASVIAVTPFNPNPQTPHVFEAVKKLQAISPSLEGRSSSLPSPQVSAKALCVALDAAVTEQPRLDRLAQGRILTLGRISPATSRRDAASSVVSSSPLPQAEADDAREQRHLGGDMVGRGGSSSPVPPCESASPL